MAPTLYYRPGTGRPARVAWALEEVGVPYVTVDISAEPPAGEAHRHPLGRVPVLADGDEVQFESTAIILSLADRHPETGLLGPLGSVQRDHVYQWAIAAMTELERAAVDHFVFADADPKAAIRGATRFAAAAPAFAAALGDREFLVGDGLTAADIVTGGVLAVADLTGLLSELPLLGAYLERLRDRPAFARAVARTASMVR